ncbi:MAG: 1-(5-phosphoribosyl)-5-[(5-phosphoribosylamino)methylideneamino] imidazole-4-carboxamide isomerase [Gemmatimonadales bacterium]|nr:MAG: 1-(5-phosphoribosyl)-5-[(5-phosphoribosylamino)methylideneamino] imidazole-4-carboxamide isomerase [Gemmatimonadales bacterium]
MKGGRTVQLVGGRPEDERVSLPDPGAVARRWREMGFGCLHVVDLDAALGTGDHLALIGQLVEEARRGADDAPPVEIQVGGGIRDDGRAAAVLDAGADRIIVGTRALEDRPWLEALARRHPGQVAVAADIRDGFVLSRGWTESTGLEVGRFLEGLGGLPLAGVLCTDVGREGRVEGIDREGVSRVLAASPHPVWISGGVSTARELTFLAEAGARGAVLGMALYTGALDPESVARRWG